MKSQFFSRNRLVEMTNERSKKEGAATAAPSLEFAISDDEYARAIRGQKAWGERVAGMLDNGEALSARNAGMVAQIVRRWASRLDETQPRSRGATQQFDHAGVALFYWKARREGRDEITQESLAEEWGVSTKAMAKVLRDNREASEKLLDAWCQGA